MTKYHPLPYLPTMFGACMLLMSIYVACLALWALAPGLPGHAILGELFPQFELLTPPSFFYGLMMSAIYGWFIAAVFVFFYILWEGIARIVSGGSGVSAAPTTR
jgi:hypothetical protein